MSTARAWTGRPYAALAGLAAGVAVTGLLLPAVIDGSSATRVGAAGVETEPATPGESNVEAGPVAGQGTPTDHSRPATGGTIATGDPGAPAPESAAANSGPGASAPEPADPAAAGGGGATDVGVTASTVKIGVLILEVGNLSRLGVNAPVVDPALLRRANQAFVDELNDGGGIHGRKVEIVFQHYDLTSAESQRAACLRLTEDAKVFAVLGEFVHNDANLCVTQEHHTPLLSTGGPGIADELFTRSRGMLFTKYPRGSRQMAHLAAELDRLDALAGKKVAIVNQRSNDPAGTVGDALEAELGRRRGTVVHRADFAADNAEAAGQVPVEVQQMRAKGAELVVLLANAVVSTQVAQAAESQRFTPDYYVTDWNYMNSDTGAQNMPASFDGSLGFTHARAYEYRAGLSPTAAGERCMAVYQRRTGDSTAPSDLSYQSVTAACAQVGEFAAGARLAGAGLTRPGLSEGLQQAGADIPEIDGWWARGGFAPGKFDFADQVRVQRWSVRCRCWTPDGPFRTP